MVNKKNYRTLNIFLVLFLLVSCVEKPKRIIKESDINFLKDPSASEWSDISAAMNGDNVSQTSAEKILGIKIGERIGIVTTIGNIQTEYEDGKRIVNFNDSNPNIRIPFNYIRPNCISNINRIGIFTITVPVKIDEKFQNKECLIIGEVKNLSVKVPSHACDNANATLDLDKVKIEFYNPEKKQ